MSEPVRQKDEQGREVLIYDNGTVKDAKTGHFLRGVTDPALNPVLADPAGMRKRGVDLLHQKAEQALDKVVIDLELMDVNGLGTGRSLQLYLEKYYTAYFKADDLRKLSAGFVKGLQALGYLTKETSEKGSPGQLHGTPAAILELVRQIEAEQAARDAKARAVDGVVK